MSSDELLLTVGLFALLLGAVLIIRQLRRRLRELARGKRRMVEEPADMVGQAFLLGGLALVQLSQLVRHVIENRVPPDPWLSLTASSGVFVLFGVSPQFGSAAGTTGVM